ncbi:MAG: LacI family DNA-binding transcriptional regulator [Planctomycetota bacterium]
MHSPRRVTLRDVAKRAEVSVAAVSDIVNRNLASKYATDTQNRVRAAMHDLGYVAERTAQSLRRGRSGTVGFVLTRGLSNPFFARVADLVDQTLAAWDLEMQLILVSGRAERAGELARRLIGSGVDGVIAGPLYPWDRTLVDQLAAIEGSRLPVVVFGNLEQGKFAEVVMLSDRVAGEVAVDYLLGMGHRSIGLLGSAPPTELLGKTFSNQDGMERALDAAGLLEDAMRWFVPIEDESSPAGYLGMASRFVERWATTAADARPTAVVCKNDQAAFALLAALAERGIDVPGDLSVLGYDNTSEGEFVYPPLTSVDPRIDVCVGEVVDRLLRLLDRPGEIETPQASEATPRTIPASGSNRPFVAERRSVVGRT